MRFPYRLVCAGALSLLLISCGGGGGGSSSSTTPPPTPPPNTVDVGGSDGYGGTDAMRFLPATLTVTAGTTVTWTFLSGPHTVTSGSGGTPDGLFSSGAPQSTGNFTHTFTTAGSYPYYCSVHGASMSGTVIVN